MKKLFFILVLLFSQLLLLAQDTVKIMEYNLLNYGNYTSYCTTINNNVSDKDNYLRTIINYIKPDIFAVNELSRNTTYQDRILNSVLNINGINYYKRASYTNLSDSYTINMLFYNSIKFTLKSQHAIETNYRDINIYKLFYNSSDLSTTHDTAFINCIAVHLKAGNKDYDKDERANETIKLMNYLNDLNVSGNYLLMGDLNVYYSSEQAFQNLINYFNPHIRFYDPINEIGYWHNNSTYASYHTQSTHTSSEGCAVTGGMDDRFDYILVSNNVLYELDEVKYLTNSYKALGQDGKHFNKAINAYPVNYSVPSEVLSALYNMSDHLPVIMNLKIDKNSNSINDLNNNFETVNFQNPVKDKLNLYIKLHKAANIKIEILSLLGQSLYVKDFNKAINTFNYIIPLYNFRKGIYFLRISDMQNHRVVRKLIKN